MNESHQPAPQEQPPRQPCLPQKETVTMDQVSPCSSKNNNHQSSSISLKDVQNESPVESEDETRVMEELDHSDPSSTSTERQQQEELLEDARLALLLPQEEEEPQDGSRLNNTGSDAANMTVEEELFAATTAINRLHYQDVDPGSSSLLSLRPPAELFGTNKQTQEASTGAATLVETARSNCDMFAANAGKIFHRFQKKQQKQKEAAMTDVESGSERERKRKRRLFQQRHQPNLEALKDFREILVSNKQSTYRYMKNQLFFVILPCTGLACFFFYVFAQPGQDATEAVASIFTSDPKPGNPSFSWFILFLGARQVITFGIGKGLQFLILSCSTRMSYGFMGPLLRLFLLQAKGWPLQLMLWTVVNFAILQGSSKFAQHWLFFQEALDVFNDTNPAGNWTASKYYRDILLFGLFSGLAIAFKRFILGLRFGKASYYRYSKRLSKTLKKVLLVSQVARQANGRRHIYNVEQSKDNEILDKWFHAGKPDPGEHISPAGSDVQQPPEYDPISPISPQTSISLEGLTKSQKLKIDDLLGEWEDADIADDEVENPSLSAIVQFRSSTSVLSSDYPFSHGFGRAKTRTDVVDGAQRLYLSLMKKQAEVNGSAGSTVLRFHTIALTALREDESFDREMAKDLVRLFRPARDGDIRLIEFCKSIDALYKAMRKLRASIANEGRMNAASEKFLNAVFYSLLALCGLGVLGVEAAALIGVLASFILGTSFMIGGAAADYFRGLLLILVQRPYDIGDRISITSPESDASPSGSSGWIVKDVTLYHTTLIYGTTQEYATISNGYLAKSRIINSARSPRASLHFLMKFGLGVSSDTVEKFKLDIMEYVKSKPREWLAFTAFRMIRFEADLGFVEYKTILQHRESWQQIGALLASLADVQSYAFTVSKEMNMGYQAPSLPVEINLQRNNDRDFSQLLVPT